MAVVFLWAAERPASQIRVEENFAGGCTSTDTLVATIVTIRHPERVMNEDTNSILVSKSYCAQYHLVVYSVSSSPNLAIRHFWSLSTY